MAYIPINTHVGALKNKKGELLFTPSQIVYLENNGMRTAVLLTLIKPSRTEEVTRNLGITVVQLYVKIEAIKRMLDPYELATHLRLMEEAQFSERENQIG